MTSQAQADANRQNPRKLSPDHPPAKTSPRSKDKVEAIKSRTPPRQPARQRHLGRSRRYPHRQLARKMGSFGGAQAVGFVWVGPPKWVRLVFFAWHAPPAPPSLHPKPVTPMETQPLASPQKTCAKSRRRQISPGRPSTNGRASAGPTILPTPWPPPAG